MLQGLIDRYRDGSQLYLILCGSSLSFMREQLLDDKSPLYGRRTAQIELAPFDFFDALGFFPGVPATDALQYYAMAGGIPLHLRQFDPTISLEENVCEAFLRPESLLYDEPTNLIKQEVQKAAPFNAVIQAIAEGRSQNNEIATAVGIQTSELTYYLKELRSIGLVSREMPVVAGSRRAVYRLSDSLFRFWYRFVLPNRTAIERGMQQRVLRSIQMGLPSFCGPVFEDVCAQWLWRQNADGSLPVEFGDLGHWWGNDPSLREEAEIDLVGVDDGRTVLVGECKWKNEDLDRDVVETLGHRSELVHAQAGSWLYAFSKSGFTRGAVEAAASHGHMQLVSFGEMCETGA
jgi:AAA+ ATPase superfamily predicted ATPase